MQSNGKQSVTCVSRRLRWRGDEGQPGQREGSPGRLWSVPGMVSGSLWLECTCSESGARKA